MSTVGLCQIFQNLNNTSKTQIGIQISNELKFAYLKMVLALTSAKKIFPDVRSKSSATVFMRSLCTRLYLLPSRVMFLM